MSYRKGIGDFSKILIFIAAAIGGIALTPLLNIQSSNLQPVESVNITYQWPGATPENICNNVAKTIEGVVSMLEGVNEVRSYSGFGLGYIQIILSNKTDIESFILELKLRINSVFKNLPAGVSFPQVYSADLQNTQRDELITYCLSGDVPLGVLEDELQNNILPVLREIKEIGDITITGIVEPALYLDYNSEALAKHQVSLQQVQEKIHLIENSLPISFVKTQDNFYLENYKLVSGDYENLNDFFNALTIKNKQGSIIPFPKIVRWHIGSESMQYIFRYNGQNTIRISLLPQKDFNAIKMGNSVHKAETKLIHSLPSNLSFRKIYDNISPIRRQLQNVFLQLLISLIGLYILIYLFTRNNSYVFSVILSILITLSISLIFYFVFDIRIDINAVAAFAISVALISDGFLMRFSYLSNSSKTDGAYPLVAASLTSLAAVVGLYALPEVQFYQFKSMAVVLMINLIISLFVSLYFMPSWGAVFWKNQYVYSSQKIIINRKPYLLFKNYINNINKRKYIFYILLALLIGLPFYLLPLKLYSEDRFAKTYNALMDNEWFSDKAKPFLEKYFGGIPGYYYRRCINQYNFSDKSKPEWILFSFQIPQGFDMDKVYSFVHYIEEQLKKNYFIDYFFTEINVDDEVTFKIYPKESNDQNQNNEIFDFLFNLSLQYKTIDFDLSYGSDFFSTASFQERADYHLNLRGYSFNELTNIAERITSDLRRNNRIENISLFSGDFMGRSELGRKSQIFELNNFSILAQGYTFDEILDYLLDNSYGKNYFGSLSFNNSLYSVYANDTNPQKSRLWEIEQKQGGSKANFIPQSLYDYNEYNTEVPIYRKNQEYLLSISYGYIGPSVPATNFYDDLFVQIRKDLPIGYKVEKYDPYQNIQKDIINFNLIFIYFIILIYIFLICSGFFNSLSSALIVVATGLLSFLGVLLAHALFAIPFNRGTIAAIIVSQGIVVNQALFIIYDYQKNLLNKPSIHAYIKAYSNRIKFLAISLISVVAGLLPVAILSAENSVLSNFASGAIGGLVFSFILVFFFLPITLIKRKKYNQ